MTATLEYISPVPRSRYWRTSRNRHAAFIAVFGNPRVHATGNPMLLIGRCNERKLLCTKPLTMIGRSRGRFHVHADPAWA